MPRCPERPPRRKLTPQETDASQRALLRVRADVIDRLVNEAGEVSIARARVEGELRSLKANLLELTNSVIRLRKEVRELEIQGESQIQSRMSQVGETAEGFDPLEFDRFTRFQELTRSLAEGINDVSTVQQSLLRNLDDADAALVAQSRLSRDLQQQLFAIRTVPFGSLSDRLYRILRQLAKELDKRANLEIRGGQVELDRAVLEKLVGPLEHLLRNALDHGIEPRERRQAAGKSETGEIALTVRQVGNEIAIELADDGGGLNLDEIRAKAIAQQRIPPDAELTSGQLIEYIFKAGFSTAAQVTQVSGRGIGMDVVRSEIATLGGRIEVSTRAGQGTVFQIYLPLTLAVAQAVLVRAGGRVWALPAPMVEQVQQLRADDLIARYRSGQVDWQGRSYPFHYLPRLLGDSQHRPESTRHNAVLLLRSGHSVAAVHVDEMVGNQEVVVKNIGPQLARVSGIAGATVLGNGEIVLIINPVQLAQRVGVVAVEAGADERLVPGITPPHAARAARAADHGRRRLADGAQDHRPPAHPRGLQGHAGQGWPRRARGAGGRDSRRHAARHRDAADGRFRAHAQHEGRSAPCAHPDHHDHVAHGGEASRPRAGARRRPLPGQAVPGRRAPGAPAGHAVAGRLRKRVAIGVGSRGRPAGDRGRPGTGRGVGFAALAA